MASALIQTTAFSPCSQLGDMIMVGAERSLESYPGLREEGYKRSHFDGDEEQDRSHVKKRRKQSKPNRITAADTVTDIKGSVLESGQGIGDLDFSETGEHFLTEGLMEINAGSLPIKEVSKDLSHLTQEQTILSNDNQDKSEKSDKMYNSTLPLNLSSMKSSAVDSLIIPNIIESQNSSSKLVPTDSMSHFQSTAHEHSKTSIAQESSFLSQSSSLLLPMFKQTQIQGQISQITSQMRIFNPEAFCDLCNKEFCNKYFLKTHKANKHGIYTESISGPSLLEHMPSLPFTNYFSTNNESFESPSTFQGSSTSKNLFSQTAYPPNRNNPKKIQNHQLLPPPPPQQQQQQQQQQTNAYSLKTNSSGNTRALCNICQREFCNKYFVRRHKLKIHGIVDPSTKDNPGSDLQENNINSQDKIDSLVSDGEVYLKQFITSNFSLDIRESCQNVETNFDKSTEKNDAEVESDTKMSLLSHNIPTSSDSSPLFKITSQNEENNKENNVSSTRLKKFGMINADAFCDICCKEYCNKYFLRTHKLKSHGILPIEDKKEDPLNGSTSGMLWYQNQTTPLNLIVNDSSSNKYIPEKSNVDSEGEDCVCTLCGRYFQGQVLLKMHQAYAHPNKYITNETTTISQQNTISQESLKNKDLMECDKQQKNLDRYSPIGKSENLKESDENEKGFINTANLQKLQNLISRLNNPTIPESSICDVCEKDVGHVSLLENHILKEHATLLEEMGNITEEDNSSSQNSVPSSYSFKKECPHCQQIFFKLSLLEQHLNDVHGDLETHMDFETLKGSSDCKDTNSSSKLNVSFLTQSPEDKQGLSAPASSFCEICKKELCNKYFMKTHMQRMHGISIENGAQIGGVVCDICNKELCSKYFLRVHKQNSHGIVDELFLPQIGLDYVHNQSPNIDPALKPSDQNDLSHRYFSHFNEVCTICNRRFRSVKWLKAHLLNDHGEEGKERWKDIFLLSGSESKAFQFEDNTKEIGKHLDSSTVFPNSSSQNSNMPNESNPNGNDSSDRNSMADKGILNNTMFSMLMNGKDSETKHYQCSYCSFTTSILAFLFIHERSHMNARGFQTETDQPFQCPICSQNLESKEHFENHKKLHNMTWQHMYSSGVPHQDLPKHSGNTLELRNDSIISKEKDKETSDILQPRHEAKPSAQSEQTNEPASIQCARCGFNTSHMQIYLNHVNKEHPYLQMDHELPSHLQQMEKILSSLACNVGIPAVFAAPRVQDHVTMQPFVLEDSEYTSNTNNSINPNLGKTFLSSLVFLPVKEKLKKSVTASFKLTPT